MDLPITDFLFNLIYLSCLVAILAVIWLLIIGMICLFLENRRRTMTPEDFLKMTITDILAMLKEEGSDSMEAKLTNNDGLGVLVKISYEPVEVE